MSDNDAAPVADDEVDVAPTKALFVEMLTRDIGLNRAIIDLIDNSVDGARRLRPGVDPDLAGLEIILTVNAAEFRIKDNCGGIGVELARKHAFRIGRPKDMPATPNSVGQFGVGMKRALFKFGRYFTVSSMTRTDQFRVNVDVDDWEKDEVRWVFKFDEVRTDVDLPESQTGTDIVVSRLRDSVSSVFGLPTFQNSLRREIESAQQEYLGRGLTIIVNGISLISSPWNLLRNNALSLEPGKTERTIDVGSEGHVHVRLFAGISEPSPARAGWYVFCNGRMVLEADQNPITGWGKLAEGRGVVAPKYHNQFARFRGYAFFDSESAGLLPWNTTKTGVDGDSQIYQAVVLDMVELMRPILEFLRRFDDEKDAPESEQPLTQAVRRAVAVAVRDITRVGIFLQPTRVVRTGPPMVSIQYLKSRDRIDALQEALGAGSAREVGATSFDLIYKQYVASK
jgi:Histidine kinase-, DNA gyrase B-, and HSP90-like ATPase